MESLIVSKNQRLVILQQTVGGIYESIPSKEEVEYYESLDVGQKDQYLQENFFSKGFAEGADNLIAISQAMKFYAWDKLFIVVEEI